MCAIIEQTTLTALLERHSIQGDQNSDSRISSKLTENGSPFPYNLSSIGNQNSDTLHKQNNSDYSNTNNFKRSALTNRLLKHEQTLSSNKRHTALESTKTNPKPYELSQANSAVTFHADCRRTKSTPTSHKSTRRKIPIVMNYSLPIIMNQSLPIS